MDQDTISLLDRFRGCLLGLACGDAVGTRVEFMPRGSFEPVLDMLGGGPFDLAPGQWTDDTSMALCLAASLLHCQGFDAADQMNRYVNWWQHGYLSPQGHCVDIGLTVAKALQRYLVHGDPMAGSDDPASAGNGSLMRLAPVALYFHPDLEQVSAQARASSATTHAAGEALECCDLLARCLHAALRGAPRDEVLAAGAGGTWSVRVHAIAQGHYRDKREDQILSGGYCVNSLEAALWCFAQAGDYRDAVLRATNLGDDADTTAAIAGQLAGAFFGVQDLPAEWLRRLAMSDEIDQFARELHAASQARASAAP